VPYLSASEISHYKALYKSTDTLILTVIIEKRVEFQVDVFTVDVDLLTYLVTSYFVATM